VRRMRAAWRRKMWIRTDEDGQMFVAVEQEAVLRNPC
jgi:hypothetical protein